MPESSLRNETQRPVRVAVFARSPLVHELLTTALSAAGLEAGVPTAAQREWPPDVAVAVADGASPADLSELLAAARRQLPTTPAGVVGGDDRNEVMAAMAGGATEYVTLASTMQAFGEKVRAVAAGGLGDAPLLHYVVARVDQQSEQPKRRAVDRLTVRERDVLVLIIRGRTTHEIARALRVGVPTVRSHVHRILTKLAVHSRVQAAAVAANRGFR